MQLMWMRHRFVYSSGHGVDESGNGSVQRFFDAPAGFPIEQHSSFTAISVAGPDLSSTRRLEARIHLRADEAGEDLQQLKKARLLPCAHIDHLASGARCFNGI